MSKLLFPLLIIVAITCIFQFNENRSHRQNIRYMQEILESKNLTINNLLKDDIYEINHNLYSYIYNVDSSLLINNQNNTLCLYISAENHCDACIEFELKYIRKNALENSIKILYSATHKSSFNSFKELNKDIPSIYFCPDYTRFKNYPTYIFLKENMIKHVYKSDTSKNGGALNFFLHTIKIHCQNKVNN